MPSGGDTLLLLRIVWIISIFPDLRVRVSGMGRALGPISAMVALTLVVLFVYGMVGVQYARVLFVSFVLIASFLWIALAVMPQRIKDYVLRIYLLSI